MDVSQCPFALQSLQAGRLHRLLHDSKKMCEEASAPTQAAPAAAGDATAAHHSSLFGKAIGPRLSRDALQKFWGDFQTNYPAEVAEGEASPCKALIQTICAQKSNKELKFIP